MGLDTKTDRLTDCQSQYDSDSDSRDWEKFLFSVSWSKFQWNFHEKLSGH
jgi:hypothetical protein